MRVGSSSPIGVRSAAGARSSGAAAPPGAFSAYVDAAGARTGVTAAAPLAQVGMIAAMQAAAADERRRKATGRGNRLLDLLDGMRHEMLAGELSRSTVSRLAAAVGEARVEADDPGLAEVLDAIELRAAVELAKHEAALAAA